jgi:hypothetical protein
MRRSDSKGVVAMHRRCVKGSVGVVVYLVLLYRREDKQHLLLSSHKAEYQENKVQGSC